MSGCCGVSTKTNALLATPHVEPCTDPIILRNSGQYLRFIKKKGLTPHAPVDPVEKMKFKNQDDTGRKEAWPQWMSTAVSIAYAWDNPWPNGSELNQCVLVMSPQMGVRFRDRWLETMSGSTRARKRCPWDSVGLFTLHSRSISTLCKRLKEYKTFRSRMTAHNLVFSTSQIDGEFSDMPMLTTLVRSHRISAVHRKGLRHFKTSSVRWGLRTREASLEEDVRITLGHVPDCREHVSKTSPARWWRLYRGLGAVLKRKAVTGDTVEKFLGVCTYVSLCRRDLALDFSTTYRFVRSSYRNPTPLWNSVRFELSLFRDLMVYLEARRRRQWNSMVNVVRREHNRLGHCGFLAP